MKYKNPEFYKLYKILEEILEIEREILFDEDLSMVGLDSLNSVNLILSLEETFNIQFEDEELLFENFTTVSKIVDMIDEKLVNIDA
ncbi:phosphopantetheine-binding protein [Bacillus cereus]|uniref:phosphopantetheine-binding protein n=1 Tax=Bacillus sp. BB56-3 TaxID=2217831 RepID=UPI0011EF77C8|nr:phosphopantetheine-binding protein [Bacillus sp. BB56-3]KAA0782851.1 hypothetical protein DN406_28650 [Bacillus sp. BB56-3]MCU4759612.1 phosphopantetheine-binding protein [Bacillus cereus]